MGITKKSISFSRSGGTQSLFSNVLMQGETQSVVKVLVWQETFTQVSGQSYQMVILLVNRVGFHLFGTIYLNKIGQFFQNVFISRGEGIG